MKFTHLGSKVNVGTYLKELACVPPKRRILAALMMDLVSEEVLDKRFRSICRSI